MSYVYALLPELAPWLKPMWNVIGVEVVLPIVYGEDIHLGKLRIHYRAKVTLLEALTEALEQAEAGEDMQEDGEGMQEDGEDVQEDGEDMQEDGEDMEVETEE
jgi:hypothetical protein